MTYHHNSVALRDKYILIHTEKVYFCNKKIPSFFRMIFVSICSISSNRNVIGGDTRIRTGDQSFADSCLTTWLCRRNAVISISDIDYIKYGSICQALFKNYSKIFYELKKRVYLFISLPIFLSAIEIVPSLLLINSIYLSSSKYSTGTVISMPVSVFIF